MIAVAMQAAEPRQRVMLPLIDLTRIGGNGACAQAAAIDGWTAEAAPGAECVYAIGHLPVWSKGPGAMRVLAERGYVHLFHDRAPQPKHYVARRTARPWAGPVRPVRVARQVACLSGHLAPAMEMLAEAAEMDLACPSNAELAEALGVTARQAAYLVGCLVRAGSIQVELVVGPPFRIVTIVQSGISTGGRA
ncbi:MAG: hypothetical protein V4618_00725 [Pseudomonadota bacterium]